MEFLMSTFSDIIFKVRSFTVGHFSFNGFTVLQPNFLAAKIMFIKTSVNWIFFVGFLAVRDVAVGTEPCSVNFLSQNCSPHVLCQSDFYCVLFHCQTFWWEIIYSRTFRPQTFALSRFIVRLINAGLFVVCCSVSELASPGLFPMRLSVVKTFGI